MPCPDKKRRSKLRHYKNEEGQPRCKSLCAAEDEERNFGWNAEANRRAYGAKSAIDVERRKRRGVVRNMCVVTRFATGNGLRTAIVGSR